jgi:hypothetical protein
MGEHEDRTSNVVQSERILARTLATELPEAQRSAGTVTTTQITSGSEEHEES